MHADLSITHLSKRYQNRPVLHDVNLYLNKGEAVALLGPNGAGKTTCFQIIAGLIKPDNGIIALNNQNITRLPMYRRARLGIGYLPQESSIFRGLSVEGNIKAVLQGQTQLSVEQQDALLEQLLAEFSIDHIRHAPALALSGGERRRTEIARALACQPDFILLDEPLAGIDPIAVNDIRALITHLKTRNIGVLITDHNVRDTLAIVDRAYILHDGHVIKGGTPTEIIADPDVKRVYLGEGFSL
jgi:lipopolysaccharide export system ATP-binding protein